MKRYLKKIICTSLISFYLFQIEKVQAIVPYYYLPSIKNLQKQSFFIANNADLLLSYGKYKDSLNLAKLAVKINSSDEKPWLILSKAQIANKQYKNALDSLDKAQKINSKNSETYFLKGNIYLKNSTFQNAKDSLETGLKIAEQPL